MKRVFFRISLRVYALKHIFDYKHKIWFHSDTLFFINYVYSLYGVTDYWWRVLKLKRKDFGKLKEDTEKLLEDAYLDGFICESEYKQTIEELKKIHQSTYR